MGVITRFFECKNKNCKAEKKRWANKNHQQEIQNCTTCNRPTNAWRALYNGRLFGEFKCDGKKGKKVCGKEWFSGNAYFKKWQICQRCSHRCTPFYLREHDKKEEENDEDNRKAHPDQLCQKCQEWKLKTGNPRARCIDYESRERTFEEESEIVASYVGGANITKMTQNQLSRKSINDKPKKVGEETLKKKETEKAKKDQTKNDKKKSEADKKPNKTKDQNVNQIQDLSDDDYWDSDNEEDRENWFYSADEVYFDAPFRLQDYKIKLDSGSVKEAPSCEPYRQLYNLHLAVLATGKQSNDKKKKAKNMFNNLYSVQIQKVANKNKKLTKKEHANKAEANSPSKDKSDDNKENSNSAKKNSKSSKSQQKEASLEDKMAALTVTSSQKATRTSTSSRRVLKQL